MSYEDENSDFEDNASTDFLDDPSLESSGDEVGTDEDAEATQDIKSKAGSTEHSLEVRRAIEDHLDRTKLQKDLDYLFDEHFTDDEE